MSEVPSGDRLSGAQWRRIKGSVKFVKLYVKTYLRFLDNYKLENINSRSSVEKNFEDKQSLANDMVYLKDNKAAFFRCLNGILKQDPPGGIIARRDKSGLIPIRISLEQAIGYPLKPDAAVDFLLLRAPDGGISVQALKESLGSILEVSEDYIIAAQKRKKSIGYFFANTLSISKESGSSNTAGIGSWIKPVIIGVVVVIVSALILPCLTTYFPG